MSGYLIGYDIGSSSIKATLLHAETGKLIASATSPGGEELAMTAPQAGWAEQDPEMWWTHVKAATQMLHKAAATEMKQVSAIGISYQMHGLVVVDKNQNVLRPSIIWCDSRAVPYGEKAFEALGAEFCLKNFLNSPGNFTASKLKWVQENEPAIYENIDKIMLPGDYIAMRLSGEVQTTASGLSEGILWNFPQNRVANELIDHYGFQKDFIPHMVPTFSEQAVISSRIAEDLSLPTNTKIGYRAGDQPNNALSLGVLNPGEIATTAGTSGVVYGVGDTPDYDPQSRVNTFVHVNHSEAAPRYGVLLCVNGTGIMNRWLNQNLANKSGQKLSYEEMNELAAQIPPGANGLTVLPYGNGAERSLSNRDLGASIHNLQLNIHTKAHMFRAAQEGIVFSLNYGLKIMKEMGLTISVAKAGYANMFLSAVFANAFATTTGAEVELYNTDGAQGAARGAGIGTGIYASPEQAFDGLQKIKSFSPEASTKAQYEDAYAAWEEALHQAL